jgi:hypothetical protein
LDPNFSVVVYVGARTGVAIDELRARAEAAANEAITAKEKIARLEKENTSSLSREQRDALVAKLRPLLRPNGGLVMLETDWGNSRAVELFGELETLLIGVNWDINPWMGDVTKESPETINRVTIRFGATSEAATCLEQGLRDAGLKVEKNVHHSATSEDIPDGPFALLVSPRE